MTLGPPFQHPFIAFGSFGSSKPQLLHLQTSLCTQKQDCIPNKNEEVGPVKAGHAGRAMPVFDKKALKLMEDAGVEILRPLGNAYTKGSEVH